MHQLQVTPRNLLGHQGPAQTWTMLCETGKVPEKMLHPMLGLCVVLAVRLWALCRAHKH